MRSLIIALSASLLAVCMQDVHAFKCNQPPSLWCSSQQIAAQCEMTEQCEQEGWPQLRDDAAAAAQPPSASPVQLEVYIESNCPDCKNFFNNQLTPTWNRIADIIDLTVVPYGNANEKKLANGTWEFFCQHGPAECVGNTIETCAIHILGSADAYFPFISCIEKSHDMPVVSAPHCAQQLKIEYDPIEQCLNSNEGNKLQHEMAVKTDMLEPPHTYVPWVTLNGVHTEEIETKADHNLLGLICETYKGKKPSACLTNNNET